MRIRRLHPDFGAEILDVDILNTGPDEVEELRAAFLEHQLLLFRGQGRTPPERQVEIASWFGPLVSETPTGEFWNVLHNKEYGGRIRLKFHCDHSYTDSPVKGISLHAIELPDGPTATAYVSNINAWARLSPERQALLAPMTLRHRHVSENKAFDWPEFISEHPVRWLHPKSGRPVLFVTEDHANRILELDQDASDRMIAELFAEIYALERIYRHEWRLHDLMVWDNLAIQHARPEMADPGKGARAMQRVSLNEVPFAELLARARVAEGKRKAVGAIA